MTLISDPSFTTYHPTISINIGTLFLHAALPQLHKIVTVFPHTLWETNSCLTFSQSVVNT